MPVPTDSQFSKQLIAELNKGLAAVNEGIALCDEGDGCGLDTSHKRQQLEEQRQTINAMKARFAPQAR